MQRLNVAFSNPQQTSPTQTLRKIRLMGGSCEEPNETTLTPQKPTHPPSRIHTGHHKARLHH